jgi:hypothetical protein
MERTFTGLKLKGDIGKFGAVEISDVFGFIEFPDGKILSGSESGFLLVWEAGLLKGQFGRGNGIPCHDGPIESVYLDTFAKTVVTAGADSCIRWWYRTSFDIEITNPMEINNILPLKEIRLISLNSSLSLTPPNNVSTPLNPPTVSAHPIRSILPARDHWVVHSSAGTIRFILFVMYFISYVYLYVLYFFFLLSFSRLDYKTDFITHLYNFPADSITSVALMVHFLLFFPSSPFLIACYSSFLTSLSHTLHPWREHGPRPPRRRRTRGRRGRPRVRLRR